VAWVFEYLEDVRSDMSVFHRVDDMEILPVTRFLSFAFRLPHYQGAMRNVALSEMVPPETEGAAPSSPSSGRLTNDDVVATNVDLMAVHPVWGAVGSFSKAPLESET
jgi:hypothetical protein